MMNYKLIRGLQLRRVVAVTSTDVKVKVDCNDLIKAVKVFFRECPTATIRAEESPA